MTCIVAHHLSTLIVMLVRGCMLTQFVLVADSDYTVSPRIECVEIFWNVLLFVDLQVK